MSEVSARGQGAFFQHSESRPALQLTKGCDATRVKSHKACAKSWPPSKKDHLAVCVSDTGIHQPSANLST